MVRGSAVGEIDHLAAMADQDVAALRAVVAVQAAHQRGLADAGRAGQHDAFAGMQFEPDAGQHRDAHAALQMQGEALRQGVGAQHELAHRDITPGNALFSDGAHGGRMQRTCIALPVHRRLTSPEGRNRTPLYARVPVAACPDDRALCPATEAKSSSEENHARTRFGTAPVGKEADPTLNPDPPLAHRAPEGGATRSPVPG